MCKCFLENGPRSHSAWIWRLQEFNTTSGGRSSRNPPKLTEGISSQAEYTSHKCEELPSPVQCRRPRHRILCRQTTSVGARTTTTPGPAIVIRPKPRPSRAHSPYLDPAEPRAPCLYGWITRQTTSLELVQVKSISWMGLNKGSCVGRIRSGRHSCLLFPELLQLFLRQLALSFSLRGRRFRLDRRYSHRVPVLRPQDTR